MLPGVFGAERVASEQKRMANVGIPMEESPVGVTHSANILSTMTVKMMWVHGLSINHSMLSSTWLGAVIGAA